MTKKLKHIAAMIVRESASRNTLPDLILKDDGSLAPFEGKGYRGFAKVCSVDQRLCSVHSESTSVEVREEVYKASTYGRRIALCPTERRRYARQGTRGRRSARSVAKCYESRVAVYLPEGISPKTDWLQAKIESALSSDIYARIEGRAK